jgi:uncharacterized membrane protein
MKFIPEWRKAWRMFSVQAMAVAGALQGAWVALPENLTGGVPAWLVHVITLSILVLGIVGRLVIQPQVRDFEDTTQDDE